MSVENINTLVVGAGQAGIAMSEHLSLMGVPHVVLERSRIAERWRSERWDSLVANGPAWHDRFPSMKFAGISPEAFPPKERMADYFQAYAAMLQAPVRTGVEVLKVERHVGRPGFRVTTSQGLIDATNVVAATGPFQRPAVPTLVDPQVAVEQLHSSAYKNPGQLAPGAVLVVGAGLPLGGRALSPSPRIPWP
jgi:putative flavoprotein involved in K+ transport